MNTLLDEDEQLLYLLDKHNDSLILNQEWKSSLEYALVWPSTTPSITLILKQYIHTWNELILKSNDIYKAWCKTTNLKWYINDKFTGCLLHKVH